MSSSTSWVAGAISTRGLATSGIAAGAGGGSVFLAQAGVRAKRQRRHDRSRLRRDGGGVLGGGARRRRRDPRPSRDRGRARPFRAADADAARRAAGGATRG